MQTVNLVQKMQKELLAFERKTLKIKLPTVYFITASKTEHQKTNLYSYINSDFSPVYERHVIEHVMDAGLHFPDTPFKTK